MISLSKLNVPATPGSMDRWYRVDGWTTNGFWMIPGECEPAKMKMVADMGGKPDIQHLLWNRDFSKYGELTPVNDYRRIDGKTKYAQKFLSDKLVIWINADYVDFLKDELPAE